jgi:hypothetical protein
MVLLLLCQSIKLLHKPLYSLMSININASQRRVHEVRNLHDESLALLDQLIVPLNSRSFPAKEKKN